MLLMSCFIQSPRNCKRWFLLLLQITPELSAVKTVAYCLKHYIHSYGGEVLGSAGSLARCRKLPCPRRRAQALTQACARTRMSVHTQGSDRATATSQKEQILPRNTHTCQEQSGAGASLGPRRGFQGSAARCAPLRTGERQLPSTE